MDPQGPIRNRHQTVRVAGQRRSTSQKPPLQLVSEPEPIWTHQVLPEDVEALDADLAGYDLLSAREVKRVEDVPEEERTGELRQRDVVGFAKVVLAFTVMGPIIFMGVLLTLTLVGSVIGIPMTLFGCKIVSDQIKRYQHIPSSREILRSRRS